MERLKARTLLIDRELPILTQQARVMVVGAHVADFSYRAGGAIINYLQSGGVVKVICATFGERSESGSLWRERPDITVSEVKRIRRGEAERAADILGTKVEFLDWDDGPLIIDDERIKTLARIIEGFGPEIVLTHWREPLSMDHLVIGKAVIRACNLSKGIHPTIFRFEPNVMQAPTTGFRADTFIDITDVFEQKMEVVKQFVTQAGLSSRWGPHANYRGDQARAMCGLKDCKQAEAYRRHVLRGGTHFV